MPARCDACQHDCPGFFRSECPGGRQYLPTRERVVDLELAAAKLRALADVQSSQMDTERRRAHQCAVVVWPFGEAPLELRNLSLNGGDEDWLVVVPAALNLSYIPWADTYGLHQVERWDLGEDGCVIIWSHA